VPVAPRFLALPLGATGLLLIGTNTLLLLLAAKAGLAGLPLALIVVSWFLKYCFIVFDALAAGEEELPVLSVEMVNPLNEQRPLALGVLLGLQYLLVSFVHTHVGRFAALLPAVLFVLTLPASIALLGLTGNALSCLWPPQLLALLRGLRWNYLLLNLATCAIAVVCYVLIGRGASAWLLVGLTQLLLMLLAALIGDVLFQHRHELGLHTRTRAERRAEEEQRQHAGARDRLLDTAYGLFRVHKPLEGWQHLQGWLAQAPDATSRVQEYRALLEAASRWEDPRPADKLANDLIALLLSRRETGLVVEVTVQRLQSNPQFLPTPHAQLQRVCQLARAAGKRALAEALAARAGIAPAE
jgi:hypothetical protein